MRVPITLSLHLPNFNYPGVGPDEVFEKISDIATTAEASGFSSVSVMDHLHQIAPVGPGLQRVKTWGAQQFIATLRTGKDPTGRQLSEVMPWRTVGRMNDQDLTAIYEYLAHSFN